MRIAAGAGLDRRRGLAIDDAHHFVERDFVGLLGQPIAAGRPAQAGHEAGRLELQENLHEEPRGNAVRLGDVADADRLARQMAGGELQHGDAGVFRLGGDSREVHCVCSPHSVFAKPLQRPARSSSPRSTARVQGQQPMLV